MKREKLTPKLFSLSCENQKRNTVKVIGLFTRPGYEIVTLAQSQTDVADTVLITIEARVPAQQVDNILLRIRKVIGVIDVTIAFGSVLRSAMYRISLTKKANAVWDIINKHNARGITLLEGNQLLVRQIGKAADIQRLFNELDGPQLLAFHHSPLTVNQPISVTEHENLSAGIFNKAVPSAAESAYAEIA